MQELDIESIINESSHTEKRKRLEHELSALQGEASSVNDMMEKAFAVLASGGPIDFVTSKLNDLNAKKDDLVQRIDVKSNEQQELLSRESRYTFSKNEIKQLVAELQSPATEELFKVRARIASRLRILIKTLAIASSVTNPS